MDSIIEIGLIEAENLYKKGISYEDAYDFENALHCYKEAASKYINLLKVEKIEQKKAIIKEMATLPLDKATKLKNKMHEGNQQLAQQIATQKISVRSSNVVLTAHASDLYERIAEAYYTQVQSKKTLLPSAVAAYIIAAQNLAEVTLFE